LDDTTRLNDTPRRSARNAMSTSCLPIASCAITNRRARSRASLQSCSAAERPSPLTFADVVEERRDALLRAYFNDPSRQRFIAIAGPPGGGKSTFAEAVCASVNASTQGDLAVVVPMDGFHYSLKQLDAFADPGFARTRRGAPFTFDAEAFVRCIKMLKVRGSGDVPTFDHAVHDPVAGGCRVLATHKIILIEGNYLLLPETPWRALVDEKVYDETWFVDTDVEEAMRRVEERHTRVGRTRTEAKARVDTNDRLNAELVVLRSRSLADVLIPTVLKPPTRE